MLLKKIEMKNFRNHRNTEIEFSENLNLFFGDNAQGKTSVLEAISYLCLTKSFKAGSDIYALNFNSNYFEVSGTFELRNGIIATVRVKFERGIGKKVFINKEEVEKFSIVVNKFPVVILSPETKEVVHGSPEERRKFFDMIMAQVSYVYTDELVDYKKILKQRNKILSAISNNEIRVEQALELLDVWDENFLNYSARIIHRRMKFLSEFKNYFKEIYPKVGADIENADIEYASQVELDEGDTVDSIKEKLKGRIKFLRSEELKRGVSLIGPHRDEFVFKIDGGEARRFASQGQSKTFLVALSVAKFFYLKEKNQETPILLFDDVFSELDIERSKRMLNFVVKTGQTFITTTQIPSSFDDWNLEAKVKKFFVNSGTVKIA